MLSKGLIFVLISMIFGERMFKQATVIRSPPALVEKKVLVSNGEFYVDAGGTGNLCTASSHCSNLTVALGKSGNNTIHVTDGIFPLNSIVLNANREININVNAESTGATILSSFDSTYLYILLLESSFVNISFTGFTFNTTGSTVSHPYLPYTYIAESFFIVNEGNLTLEKCDFKSGVNDVGDYFQFRIGSLHFISCTYHNDEQVHGVYSFIWVTCDGDVDVSFKNFSFANITAPHSSYSLICSFTPDDLLSALVINYQVNNCSFANFSLTESVFHPYLGSLFGCPANSTSSIFSFFESNFANITHKYYGLISVFHYQFKTFEVNACKFDSITSSSFSACIHAGFKGTSNYPTLSIVNTEITNCVGADNGGAVYVGVYLSVSKSRFDSCSTKNGKRGALYINTTNTNIGKIKIEDSEFTGNSGGAIFSFAALVVLSNVKFGGNIGDDGGRDLHVTVSSVIDCTIIGNGSCSKTTEAPRVFVSGYDQSKWLPDCGECSARIPNIGDAQRCALCDDKVSCYTQVDDTCSEDCTSGYEKNDKTLSCDRLACEKRPHTAGDPCDADCFYLGTGCVSACPGTDHYNIIYQNCVEKDCHQRVLNTSAEEPCGSGNCYVDLPSGIPNKCAAGCTYSEHYEPSPVAAGEPTYKECVPKKCNTRTKNGSDSIPCGEGACYVDTFVGANKCNDDCSNDLHYYHPGASKVCQIRMCDKRESNGSTTDPCGKNDAVPCYLTQGGTCDTSCPTVNHYEPKAATGKCELKDCIDRKKDESQGYWCGDSDCRYHTNDTCSSAKCKEFEAADTKAVCKTIECESRTISTSSVCRASGESISCSAYVETAYTDAVGTPQPGFEGCILACPAAHFVDNNGKCVLKGCTSRSLNSTAKYPCGSGDCYPVDGTCKAACANPDHYEGDISTGKCKLRDCHLRNKIGTGLPCGSSDCFWDPQDSDKCALTCSDPAYEEQPSTGKCIVKSICGDIPSNPSAVLPAIPCTNSICFMDVNDDDKCVGVGSCKNPNHYFGDTASGKCELKDCHLRSKIGTGLPCGSSDCFLNPQDLDKCALSCSNPYAYEEQPSTGTCVLKSNCGSITSNPSAVLPDIPCTNNICFMDVNDGDKCVGVDSCKNPNHYYGNPASGKCELKICNKRGNNGSTVLPCGSSDCYWDPEDSGKCTTACSNPSAYEAQSGVCVLKLCKDRIKHTSGKPCNTNCYLDVDQLTCTTTCSHPLQYKKDDTSGKCELKDCNDRKKDNLITYGYPCGTSTCYLNGESCTDLCTPTQHYIGDSYSGKCILNECGARSIWTSGTTYPCGSENCYRDVQTGTCTESCQPVDLYVGSTTNGECQLRECPLRKPILALASPCGPNCFFDENSARKCVDNCASPDHYFANSTTWLCEPIVTSKTISVGGVLKDDKPLCGIPSQDNCATLIYAYQNRLDTTTDSVLALRGNMDLTQALFISDVSGLTVKSDPSSSRYQIKPSISVSFFLMGQSADQCHVTFEKVDFSLSNFLGGFMIAPLLYAFSTTLTLTDVAFAYTFDQPYYSFVSLHDSTYTFTNVVMDRTSLSASSSLSSLTSSESMSQPSYHTSHVFPTFPDHFTRFQQFLHRSAPLSNQNNNEASDVCLLHSKAVLLEAYGSTGVITHSSFRLSNVGVAAISGGEVEFVDSTFAGNVIKDSFDRDAFPELRHNVYAEDGARVVFTGITREDENVRAYWIGAVGADTDVVVAGANVGESLFVPQLKDDVVVVEDPGTSHALTNITIHGVLLLPCGINAVIVRRPLVGAHVHRRTRAGAWTGRHAHTQLRSLTNDDEVDPEADVVAYTATLHPNNNNLIDSTHAELSLPRADIFTPLGEYYLFLTYGPGGRYRTSEVYLKNGDGEKREEIPTKSKTVFKFPAWAIVLIVVVVVVLIAVIVILLVMYRRLKSKAEESPEFDTSQTGTVLYGSAHDDIHEHVHIAASGKEKRQVLFEENNNGEESTSQYFAGREFSIQNVYGRQAGAGGGNIIKDSDQFADSASSSSEEKEREKNKPVIEINRVNSLQRSSSIHDPVGEDSVEPNTSTSTSNSTSPNAPQSDSEADMARADNALEAVRHGAVGESVVGDGANPKKRHKSRRHKDGDGDSDSSSSSSGVSSVSDSSADSDSVENEKPEPSAPKKKKKKKKKKNTAGSTTVASAAPVDAV